MSCFYLVSEREYYCTVVGVAPKSEWLAPARADSTYLPVACILLYGDFEDRGVCVVLNVQDIMTESSCHCFMGWGGGACCGKQPGNNESGMLIPRNAVVPQLLLLYWCCSSCDDLVGEMQASYNRDRTVL